MTKRMMVFDLDGTLAESKALLDSEMSALIGRLTNVARVAVISGADWLQFEKQLLTQVPKDAHLANLSILPTCGTKFYKYDGGDWQKQYSEDFTPEERNRIIDSMEQALVKSGFKPEQTWGELIEDRGSQITFSALGQEAPVDVKKVWDPDFQKRQKIKAIMDPLLPDFTVRLGGATSIDITKPGIDKAYGIQKIVEILGVDKEDMLFVGDALFPGGNDYPVKECGVDSIMTRDPEETKRIIETFLACTGESD
jgi:HAD superfamily hydrolase (TIGR01484 family)